MIPKLMAVLIATAALPLAAQTASPRTDARTPVPVQAEKAKPDAKVTAKERARLAKSQNKGRKVAKDKQDRQQKKQAPAG